MRLGILGPLLVVDHTDRQVSLPTRQRTLLAALLVHANRIVPADVLAELVWDGMPPGGAVDTLRSYVARLRRSVGSALAARVVTRDPGYGCEVAEDELDVLGFQRWSRDAGAAARLGTWADAAASATRALELWRGAPLLDVPSQVLRDEFVPQLDQMRLQVLEHRVEADLWLDRHDRLVPELRRLTAEHPLQERFHAQLMSALARNGLRAEALAAYRDARRALADELGIEPGSELRDLHDKILSGDAIPVRSSAAADIAPTRIIPRQLPAQPRFFTGRVRELASLVDLPEPTGTVVTWAIDGMAGIGKTALAVRAAHELIDRFPDGQLCIDLYGCARDREPRTAGEALAWFLRALGVPPGQIPFDEAERAAHYRQRLAGTNTLILLDNASDETQVRPLLPGSVGCLVLVTSRRRLKGLDDARAINLDVLPPAEAVALLRSVVGPERVSATDPVLAEIAQSCGWLPLALRIAGAVLRHRPAWPVAHLAELLRDRRLGALCDGERDVGAVFDMSYHGTTADNAACLLADLVDHNLLVEQPVGRYRTHDLLRAYARGLAEQDTIEQRTTAMNRLLDHYQHTAAQAAALVDHHHRPRAEFPVPARPNLAAALAWLRAERSSLLAALRYTTIIGAHDRVVALTVGVAGLLRIDGPWSDALTLHATAVASARRLGDRDKQAAALTELGRVRGLLGDYPGAARDLRQAEYLYRDAGDWVGQATALVELGRIRAAAGDFRDDIDHMRAALRLGRATRTRGIQAAALTELGRVRGVTGDWPSATRDLRRALRLYRGLADQRGQAVALALLGQVRTATGDHPAAARDLDTALALCRDAGSPLGQAHTLFLRGQLRSATGDCAGATHDVTRALDLFRDLGERNGQAKALVELGHLRRLTGDAAGAVDDLDQALNLFRSIGVRGNRAWALNHFAAALTAAGQARRGLGPYHDALRAARRMRQPHEQARALEGIGECHLRIGDPTAGIAHLERALDLFQRTAMPTAADRVRNRLAHLRSIAVGQVHSGRPDQAVRTK